MDKCLKTQALFRASCLHEMTHRSTHPLVPVVKWINILQWHPDKFWRDVTINAWQLLACLQVEPGFGWLLVPVSIMAILGILGLLLSNPLLQCSQGFASEPPQAIRTRW